MQSTSRRVLLGLFGALMAVLGCQKAPPKVEPVEVQGKLTTDTGKPLITILVRFHPQDETNKSGQILTCVTTEKGIFAGQCLPGKYRVTLSTVPIQEGGGPSEASTSPGTVARSKVTIPADYNSPTNTPLGVVIPSEGKRDLIFTMRTR